MSFFEAHEGTHDKYYCLPFENFVQRWITFRDKCETWRLDEENMSRDFYVMLCEIAITFYQNNMRNKNMTVAVYVEVLRTRFYTAERTQAIERARETISFAKIRKWNPNKTIYAQLDDTITFLGDVYALLQREYRHESIHRNPILIAVRDDLAR